MAEPTGKYDIGTDVTAEASDTLRYLPDPSRVQHTLVEVDAMTVKATRVKSSDAVQWTADRVAFLRDRLKIDGGESTRHKGSEAPAVLLSEDARVLLVKYQKDGTRHRDFKDGVSDFDEQLFED